MMRALVTLSFEGYTLDHSWEIVTGVWTFEMWDGDRKLLSQSFKIMEK
jgi:hypothetical protein